MLTIGEVAQRTGLRTSALRYYEAEGILSSPARIGGQRRYDDAVLARLAVVRLAQEVGFSVAEIRALVEGFNETAITSERWQALASRKLGEIDDLIRRAEHMKHLLQESLSCGCVTLEACQLVMHHRDPCSGQEQEGPARGDTP